MRRRISESALITGLFSTLAAGVLDSERFTGEEVSIAGGDTITALVDRGQARAGLAWWYRQHARKEAEL